MNRPVSDSPTVFSLAHRQISLVFLAEREKRSLFSLSEKNESDLLLGVHAPPPKKTLQDADSLMFGVVYIGPTYFMLNFIAHAKQHAKV